jgi:membrane-associated PAP2 superfamily phosphatase
MKTHGNVALVVYEKLRFRQIGMATAAVTVMTALQAQACAWSFSHFGTALDRNRIRARLQSCRR